MIIIGVDFHPGSQQIASVDTDTGEFQGKPETFDFLGFTHISGKNNLGRFAGRRRTIAETHAGKAFDAQDGAPQANTRSLVPNRSVAQIDRARPLQLLRGTRQRR
jgi:hypothetical protein